MKIRILFIGLCCVILQLIYAQNPTGTWMKYDNPEEVGWNIDKLEEAKSFAEEINSAAFMVIYKGKVLVDWGEVERRFMCHSTRKTFLSLLYGKYVDNGMIDLDQSLADLGIDDIHNLTDVEKTAKIQHLLQARSGVYHPAAYETASMKKARPKRGAHKPGTFWYYNNWDFNTSCEILQMHSGKDFFEDFKVSIADRIGLEDFRLDDCYYHLEEEHSQYPAYPFRMSARDFARVGQLYLQKGLWSDEQIISADWIEESTTPYSFNARSADQGYAYMIWTENLDDGQIKNYSARGVGNQAIVVYPELDLVMVNRTNTYIGRSVSNQDLNDLMLMIIKARDKPVQENPELVQLTSRVQKTQSYKLTMKQKEALMGCYNLRGTPIVITLDHGQLLANIYQRGNYYLIPQSETKFTIEDQNRTIIIERDQSGRGIDIDWAR